MANNDYIPAGDSEFDDFQSQFIDYAGAKITDWSIPQTAWDALFALQQPWEDAWNIAKDKTSRTSAQVQAKDDAREAYEVALRDFIQEYITHNSLVTNSQRQDMDLPIPDDTPTPAPVPTVAPSITIHKINHLQHVLRIVNPATPGSRAKPSRVRFTQIWRAFSDTEPQSAEDYAFYKNAGSFSFKSEFQMADQGKKVWYIGRYENTRGQTGPWSSSVSGIVA